MNAKVGDSLLDVAKDNDVDLEGEYRAYKFPVTSTAVCSSITVTGLVVVSSRRCFQQLVFLMHALSSTDCDIPIFLLNHLNIPIAGVDPGEVKWVNFPPPFF